jgi:hypothetical protein
MFSCVVLSIRFAYALLNYTITFLIWWYLLPISDLVPTGATSYQELMFICFVAVVAYFLVRVLLPDLIFIHINISEG